MAPFALLVVLVLAIFQTHAQNASEQSSGVENIMLSMESLLENPNIREEIAKILVGATSQSAASAVTSTTSATTTATTSVPAPPIVPDPVPTPSPKAAVARTTASVAASTPVSVPASTPASVPASTTASTQMTFKGQEIGIFMLALESVKMSDMLDSAKYTVFAPTDTAIGVALRDLNLTQAEFLQDKKQLRTILSNHFVVDQITGFVDGDIYESEAGEELNIFKPEDNGTISVGTVGSTAEITAFNVENDGAQIYVVDQILLPFKKSAKGSLLSAMEASIRLSTMADAIVAAGLVDIFSDGSLEYTIFAPNNYAFEQILGDVTVEDLASAGQDILRDIIYYHVIPTGRFNKNSLFDDDKLQTLIGGEKLTYVFNENSTAIRGSTNRANVIEFDLYGGQGVIHIIDAVLDYVPGASANETAEASMVKEEKNETVAGDELDEMKDLGLSVSLTLLDNDTNDTATPESTATLAPRLAPPLSPVPEKELQNVIESAIDNFITAINVGEVEVSLSGDQGYTIFAPTVSAFNATLALYEATDIQTMSKKMLQDIILQHVVVGSFSKALLEDGSSLEALQDPSLRVLIQNGTTVIASTGAQANIIIPDLPVEKSIVHIIDNVLVPFVPTVQVPANTCNNVTPDYRFNCAEQKEFGKCEEPWMIEENYCRDSCGRCGAASNETVTGDACDSDLVDDLVAAMQKKLTSRSSRSCRGDELEEVLQQVVEKVIAGLQEQS